MALQAVFSGSDFVTQCRIQRGRQVLLAGMAIIRELIGQLNDQFSAAVEIVVQCQGQVIVTGIGKAGIIGRKLAASLTSTGTPSQFLHAAEAVHGDLGCVSDRDVVIVLSYSGETEEVTRLLPVLKSRAKSLLAITASRESSLGRMADVTLELGYHDEACSLGLAPSTTTTGMLALCDALAVTVCEERGFTQEQFALFHPAGSLGRQLMSVCDAMRPLIDCRVASESLTVRQVMIQVSRPGRRTGAVMLLDCSGKLAGIFTDSDLARLLERRQDDRLDEPVSAVMTKQFQTISQHSRLHQATELMAVRKISELPVIDDTGCPLGILDLTDLVGMVSPSQPSDDSKSDLPEIGCALDLSTTESELPVQKVDAPPIISLVNYRQHRQ